MTWSTAKEYVSQMTTCVVIRIESGPYSGLVIGFVTTETRHVLLVIHELIILPEQLSSPSVLVGIVFLKSLFSVQWFVDHCNLFLFLLAISCMSVFHRFTGSVNSYHVFFLFRYFHIQKDIHYHIFRCIIQIFFYYLEHFALYLSQLVA